VSLEPDHQGLEHHRQEHGDDHHQNHRPELHDDRDQKERERDSQQSRERNPQMQILVCHAIRLMHSSGRLRYASPMRKITLAVAIVAAVSARAEQKNVPLLTGITKRDGISPMMRSGRADIQRKRDGELSSVFNPPAESRPSS
jgi:hypothetical protein